MTARTRPPLDLNRLEAREVPAVLAAFNTDTLIVTGDHKDNSLTVQAAADGTLQVLDGTTAVPIRTLFGTPTRLIGIWGVSAWLCTSSMLWTSGFFLTAAMVIHFPLNNGTF